MGSQLVKRGGKELVTVVHSWSQGVENQSQVSIGAHSQSQGFTAGQNGAHSLSHGFAAGQKGVKASQNGSQLVKKGRKLVTRVHRGTQLHSQSQGFTASQKGVHCQSQVFAGSQKGYNASHRNCKPDKLITCSHIYILSRIRLI